MDWNAVGAIGQWVGSIATTIAIIISLILGSRSTKPKLKIRAQVEYLAGAAKTADEWARNGVRATFFVAAYNNGVIPLSIRSTNVGFSDGFWMKPPEAISKLPKGLEPGEPFEFEINPYELATLLQTRNYREDALISIYFQDGTGRYHRKRVWFDTNRYGKRDVPRVQPVRHKTAFMRFRYMIHQLFKGIMYVRRNKPHRLFRFRH